MLTMRWFLAALVIVPFIGVIFIGRTSNKNVCRTFKDYYSIRDNNENCYYNPDAKLTVPEIIHRHGYPVETHYVTTEDGYTLTVFRIPHGRNTFNKKPGKPVFLQHGYTQNCGCFVNRGQKSLANEGYDVWLGNFRGNFYSKNHTYLSDTDSRYWDFSFHEHGVYDLRVQLDLVNNLTKEKLTYIGFSMGTTTMYVYGVTYPDESYERIKMFVNLSPSAFLKENRSYIKYVSPYWNLIEPIVQFLTNGQVSANVFHPFMQAVCLPFPFQMSLCQFPLQLLFGFHEEQSDPETLPISFLQGTDSAAFKAFTHFIQLERSGKFRQFDYGSETNTEIYGNPEPPQYDLSKMRVPTYFIRAENDWLITKENVEKLYNSLPNHTSPHDIYVVEDEGFSHLDFVSAKDVVPLVYNHIVDFLHTQQTQAT